MIQFVCQDHQPASIVESSVTSPVEGYVDMASLPPISVVILLGVNPVHSPIVVDNYRIVSRRLLESLLGIRASLEINPRSNSGIDQVINLLPLLLSYLVRKPHLPTVRCFG